MDKLTALLSMKSALCEALRADLEDACNKLMRRDAQIEELTAELDIERTKNSVLRVKLEERTTELEGLRKQKAWWYHQDRDAQYGEYGPAMTYYGETEEQGTEMSSSQVLPVSVESPASTVHKPSKTK